MDLARAFVDDRAFGVSIVAPDGIFIRVSVGAVYLHGIRRRALGRDRRKPFRQAGLSRIALPCVLQPRRSQPQQPRRLIVGFHLRDHFLDELVLADLDAERLSLARVFRAGIAARADEAGRAGRDRQPSLIERKHRNLESFARLADEVVLGHLDAIHVEEARVAGEDAPLLRQRPARKSLEAALDDERAQARRIFLPLLVEIGPGNHQKRVGHVGQRDPHLLAVQHVAIAALLGRRLDAARIAAGRRLGQAVRADQRALRLRNEILLLLRFGAPRRAA